MPASAVPVASGGHGPSLARHARCAARAQQALWQSLSPDGPPRPPPTADLLAPRWTSSLSVIWVWPGTLQGVLLLLPNSAVPFVPLPPLCPGPHRSVWHRAACLKRLRSCAKRWTS